MAVVVVAVMVIVCGRRGCARHGLWPSLSNPVPTHLYDDDDDDDDGGGGDRPSSLSCAAPPVTDSELLSPSYHRSSAAASLDPADTTADWSPPCL